MLVKNKKRGFTLIELLVVIAIIGILATIVLVSLNTARAKARDARRSSDLHQIALAMEMYYDSQSPVSYPNVDGVTNDFVLIAAGSSIGTYMNPVPLDPNNTAGPPDLRYYWTGWRFRPRLLGRFQRLTEPNKRQPSRRALIV
jgi:prepilin-type N-terminal cleavage/methylation domain-containing protein